jgi:uncharacterized protein YcnI
VLEAVERVRWSGGSLPDEHFDDFSLLLRLPDAPRTLGFRVLQECEEGQADWAQPPGAGKERARYPMPLLRVTPGGDEGHRH